MSFRDRVSFSMVATRERQHNDRIARISKFRTRVLPISAIYGGNASGKTNFFKALSFARKFVVEGSRPGRTIQVSPFQLDPNCEGLPSRFEFEIFVEEKIYLFTFAVDSHQVLEESLVEIRSSSDHLIYDRSNREINILNSRSADLFNEQDNSFFTRMMERMEGNQLFLTEAVSYELEKLRPIYNWFAKSLELVAPDSRFMPFHLFFSDTHPLREIMNDKLRQLDTGIDHLGSEEIPFDSLPLTEDEIEHLQTEILNGEHVPMYTNPSTKIVISRKGDELFARRLVTFHTSVDNTSKKFGIFQESDGSKRVIDLLPALIELSSDISKVYVIDELDRSLHTLLARKFIESFLSCCSNESRSQLLMTTHDVMLMDQSLFRRDEMWLTERSEDGSSNLYSIAEFEEAKKDKDIRDSYLHGRMGGIPQIFLQSNSREKIDSQDNLIDESNVHG